MLSRSLDVWLSVQDCRFSLNYAKVYGGDIDVRSSEAEIVRSNFWAGKSGNGGSIRSNGGKLLIDDSTFFGSSATTTHGGCIALLNGDYKVSRTTLTLCSALLNGGGVFCESAKNCAFQDVSIDSCQAKNSGGAITCRDSACTLVQTVL